jgi:hypothetical protein
MRNLRHGGPNLYRRARQYMPRLVNMKRPQMPKKCPHLYQKLTWPMIGSLTVSLFSGDGILDICRDESFGVTLVAHMSLALHSLLGSCS